MEGGSTLLRSEFRGQQFLEEDVLFESTDKGLGRAPHLHTCTQPLVHRSITHGLWHPQSPFSIKCLGSRKRKADFPDETPPSKRRPRQATELPVTPTAISCVADMTDDDTDVESDGRGRTPEPERVRRIIDHAPCSNHQQPIVSQWLRPLNVESKRAFLVDLVARAPASQREKLASVHLENCTVYQVHNPMLRAQFERIRLSTNHKGGSGRVLKTFHGTAHDAALNIAQEGFRKGTSRGFFGAGIYSSRLPSKALFYSRSSGSRTSFCLFLCEVCPGPTFLFPENASYPSLTDAPLGYTSVAGHVRRAGDLPEIVVYDSARIIPTYLFVWERKPPCFVHEEPVDVAQPIRFPTLREDPVLRRTKEREDAEERLWRPYLRPVCSQFPRRPCSMPEFLVCSFSQGQYAHLEVPFSQPEWLPPTAVAHQPEDMIAYIQWHHCLNSTPVIVINYIIPAGLAATVDGTIDHDGAFGELVMYDNDRSRRLLDPILDCLRRRIAFPVIPNPQAALSLPVDDDEEEYFGTGAPKTARGVIGRALSFIPGVPLSDDEMAALEESVALLGGELPPMPPTTVTMSEVEMMGDVVELDNMICV